MKAYKKHSPLSYALGMALTIELLTFRINEVTKVYIHSTIEKNQVYKHVVDICRRNKIEMIENDKVFRILSPKENCFMIGEFKKFEQPITNSNHIMLVNPANAGNLGTIIRTAIGFGVKEIALIKPCVDIFDPKVIRASMGAVFQLHFSYFDTFKQYQSLYPNHNYYCFRLQSNQFLHQVKWCSPYTLIFGNEGTGLPDSYASIGTGVRIAHLSTIDSLNLPIAVSIALYQATLVNIKGVNNGKIS